MNVELTEKQLLNLETLNWELERREPQEILVWAVETFWPDVMMSSSFQTQSVPLLHIVSQVKPELRITFIDTGYHFPETLSFLEYLRKRYCLNICKVHPLVSREELIERYGDRLYHKNPDLCCKINKVEPMRRIMEGLKVWISGVRRDQTETRKDIRILEFNDQGILRIHPFANWTSKDVWNYIQSHSLPVHPLYHKGYLSISCAPCTRAVKQGEDEREGLWPGMEKKECGLHTLLRHIDRSK